MGPGAACAEPPEPFDYDAYLAFLARRGHNFIRLWRWEQFKFQAAGGSFHLCMAPQPWMRSGSGTATDGKPRFDLDKFDLAFFDRLRAGERRRGYPAHPIGMTMQFPVADQRRVNDPLFGGPADWISPGYDDEIFTEGRQPNEPGGPASH